MKRCCAPFLFAFLFGAFGSQPAPARTPTWKHQLVFNSGPQFVIEDFAGSYKTGLAIDAGYYYRTSEALFVGVFGGYHQFKGEGGTADLNITPANLAFKYNLSLTGIQPYIGAEGGLFFLHSSNDDSSTEIGLSPRLGLRVPLSRGLDLDLNVKYNLIFLFSNPSNFTYVGTNGGFAYILDRAKIQHR